MNNKQTREQMLANRKAYREANKEKIRLASKKYYEEHKDEINEKSKKYNQANPEKNKQYKMKPESIAKDKKYKSTAEYKARQKENNKVYYSKPENKSRHFSSCKYKKLFRMLNIASLALSVVGLTGIVLGAKNLLPLCLPLIILIIMLAKD